MKTCKKAISSLLSNEITNKADKALILGGQIISPRSGPEQCYDTYNWTERELLDSNGNGTGTFVNDQDNLQWWKSRNESCL